jgi:yecA family protein
MDADYQRVDDALQAVGAEVGAAEAQGLLCGMASVSDKPDKAAWIAVVLADTQPRGEDAKVCLTLLVSLYESTLPALDDESMRFQPLLPDDVQPLAERAQALAQWASGFLTGMALGGLKKDAALPQDVREALHDMDAVTQVQLDPGGEDDEAAYAELVEYLKVATLLVRANLRPASAPAQNGTPDKRLH